MSTYNEVLQNRTVRKQIILTEDAAAKLKAVSEGTGLSQNEIVNRGLSAYMSKFKKFSTENN